MTGIILAGGKGRRLGNLNKTFIKLGKVFIIEHVIKKLKEAFLDNIIICGRQEDDSLKHITTTQGVIFAADKVPDRGPIGGLYTGLISSDSFYNFVVAGDMPFLNPNLINYMKAKVDNSDVIIPKTKKGVEPLHAIYSKNCLEVIQQKIFTGKETEKENFSLTSLLREVKVEYILEEEIRQFSLPEIAFFNINTFEELAEGERLANQYFAPDDILL